MFTCTEYPCGIRLKGDRSKSRSPREIAAAGGPSNGGQNRGSAGPNSCVLASLGFRSPVPGPDVMVVTRRDSSPNPRPDPRPDPWPPSRPGEPHIDRLINRGLEGILAASADGAPGSLVRALFEALRGFPSVQSATLWQAANEPVGGATHRCPSAPAESSLGPPASSYHLADWHHVRSLGAPMPYPGAVCGPSWSVPGYTVLQATPLGALVMETTPTADQEDEIIGIECLLALCTSLYDLEAAPLQAMLEDVAAALPKIPPQPDWVDPLATAPVDSDPGRSDSGDSASPPGDLGTHESASEPDGLPNLGDAAA